MSTLSWRFENEAVYLEKAVDLKPDSVSCSGRFKELIKHLEQKAGQRVVVLIDEYDKPILDAINQPDIARENRDFLRLNWWAWIGFR